MKWDYKNKDYKNGYSLEMYRLEEEGGWEVKVSEDGKTIYEARAVEDDEALSSVVEQMKDKIKALATIVKDIEMPA